MDQNPNDNDLFNLDSNPPSQPGAGPTPPPTGSARVYNTPEPSPYSSAPAGEPSYQSQPETPSYVSTPPTYTTPSGSAPASPSFWESNKTWIIALIVILLLCCCCLILIPVILWFTGDDLFNLTSTGLHHLAQLM